jgi:hypothetical protein
MNRLSKTLTLGFTGVIAAVLVVVGVTPGTAQAAAGGSQFCTNLTPTISKVNTSISNLTLKLTTARDTRDQKRTADQTKWDEELAASRDKWDAARQDDFDKLTNKASSDTQQAAVQTYITNTTNAITARRAANDVARKTYRTGVDGVLAAQRTTVDGQVAGFKNAVVAAENAAQASCNADPANGPTARVAFQASLKTARQAFLAQRKDDGTVANQVKALATARDDAIQANDTAFKNTMNTNRSELKSGYGDSSV